MACAAIRSKTLCCTTCSTRICIVLCTDLDELPQVSVSLELELDGVLREAVFALRRPVLDVALIVRGDAVPVPVVVLRCVRAPKSHTSSEIEIEYFDVLHRRLVEVEHVQDFAVEVRGEEADQSRVFVGTDARQQHTLTRTYA